MLHSAAINLNLENGRKISIYRDGVICRERVHPETGNEIELENEVCR